MVVAEGADLGPQRFTANDAHGTDKNGCKRTAGSAVIADIRRAVTVR